MQKLSGRRSAALLLAACLAIAACGSGGSKKNGQEKAKEDRYVVRIDVTKWIHDLSSDDMFLPDNAAEALANIGPAVIPILERAWNEEPAKAREVIVSVLDDLDTPETIPLLLRAARDENQAVRADAVTTLGRLQDKRGREAVENALHDENPSVVASAAYACRVLCRSPKAIEELVRRAIDGTPRASNSIRRMLGGNDSQRAATVRKAIEHIAPPALNRISPQERVRAALLLLSIDPTLALPTLRNYVQNGPRDMLRIQAIDGLGSAGDKPDVEILDSVRALGRSDPASMLACNALRQLVRRGIDEAKPAVMKCPAPRPKRGRRKKR